MSLQQARTDLTAATDAHEAALEALRAAKITFFDSAADKDRKAVVTAEEAVRSAALLLERAEHFFQTAQREAAEQTLAGKRQRLEELKAAQLASSARVSEALTLLVDLERQASELIGEVERLTEEQAQQFHERKSLSVAVGEATPSNRMKNATDARYELQALIKAAQIREHRDVGDNGRVSGWLQPAAFATSNKLLQKEASNA